MCRVVKPGGVAVFIVANPRPLLFWGRLVKRLVADMPVLSHLVNSLRRSPPLAFRPVPLRWMRQQLAPIGRVSVSGHAMASTWFNQNVSERRGLGLLAWRSLAAIERKWPGAAARLGCYVQLAVQKQRSGGIAAALEGERLTELERRCSRENAALLEVPPKRQRPDLCYELDRHWSAAGYVAVADMIAGWLQGNWVVVDAYIPNNAPAP